MPIYKMTAEEKPFGAGLPQIGTLRKGAPHKKNDRLIDLDYFRVDFEPHYHHLSEAWFDLYGDKPAEFSPVRLIGDTVDDGFPNWKEDWRTSSETNQPKLIRRCNGVTQLAHREEGYLDRTPIPCISGAGACRCKPVGRLKLLLPEFIQATGVFGYFALSTHSIYDIISIDGALKTMQRMGDLWRFEFWFGRAPRKVSAPKPGGKPNERIDVEKSLLYLRPLSSFNQPLFGGAVLSAAPRALPSGDELLTLPETAESGGSWYADTEQRGRWLKWLKEAGLKEDDLAENMDILPSDFDTVEVAVMSTKAAVKAWHEKRNADQIPF